MSDPKKIEFTEEWCLKAAEAEEGCDVTAGKTAAIGYRACWARHRRGRCRLPRGHDGSCVPVWFEGDGPDTVLFLDFDGVLHPYPVPSVDRLFEQVDRLRGVLKSRPWVGVVVHSSWRCGPYYSDDEFRQFLGVGRQLLGTTPRDVLGRWESIVAWLKLRPALRRFVVVDDMRGSFPAEAHGDLICPHHLTGMMEADWRELERRLDAD